MQTTLILVDYGPKIGIAFREACPGYTVDDAVSDILAGQIGPRIIKVVSVTVDGEAKDVSQHVADRIIAAWNGGQTVSDEAKEFVEYCGLPAIVEEEDESFDKQRAWGTLNKVMQGGF